MKRTELVKIIKEIFADKIFCGLSIEHIKHILLTNDITKISDSDIEKLLKIFCRESNSEPELDIKLKKILDTRLERLLQQKRDRDNGFTIS